MAPRLIVPIVEGDGEVDALPVLLHRIAEGLAARVRVNPPIRVKSGSFLNDDTYFHRYFTLAATRAAHGAGMVLIVLDSDHDGACPATDGPRFLRRALSIRDDVMTQVAMIRQEFESAFIAAFGSLVAVAPFGLQGEAPAIDTVERIRNAKGWIAERRAGSVGYDPIRDQAAFTRRMSLEQARGLRSFDRLCRKVEDFLRVDAAGS